MAKTQSPKKKGRPTLYTQKLADQICERLALGESMRTVSSSAGYPSMETMFRWIREREDFREQYARAKQESADAMAEDIMDISDDGSNDWMEKQYGRDTASTWVINGEALQRSRLRVDTRKWLMAKMKPKKYGEKIDVTTQGEKIAGFNYLVPKENDTDDNTQSEATPGVAGA